MAKVANLALSFVLELCLLAAFGYWGFKTGTGLLQQILLGIGIALVIATIWGIFLAPASKRRLPGVARLLLKTVLFGLGVSALYASGRAGLAISLGMAFVVNSVLAILWGQERLSETISQRGE